MYFCIGHDCHPLNFLFDRNRWMLVRRRWRADKYVSISYNFEHGKAESFVFAVYLDQNCFRCLGNPHIVIPIGKLCNGIIDCPDLTDECLCPIEERISVCDSTSWGGFLPTSDMIAQPPTLLYFRFCWESSIYLQGKHILSYTHSFEPCMRRKVFSQYAATIGLTRTYSFFNYTQCMHIYAEGNGQP